MSMIKWTPRKSLMTSPSYLDQLFSDFGMDFRSSDTVWSPAVDIAENEKEYEVKAELPGMKKDEIKISFKDDVLTLSGERKSEKEEDDKNFHRIERSYGQFERCFHLPKNVKVPDIKADYKNGILTVNIPKSEEAKPKEIAIS